MPATGDQGHNVIGISQSSLREYVALHSELVARRVAINAKIARLRKVMKSEGIELTIFDAMQRLSALPRHEQVRHMQHSQQYLRAFGSPIGEQFRFDFANADAFDDRTDAEIEAQRLEDARAQGWRAGFTWEASEADCPYAPNEPLGQAWIGAWRDARGEAVDTVMRLGDKLEAKE